MTCSVARASPYQTEFEGQAETPGVTTVQPEPSCSVSDEQVKRTVGPKPIKSAGKVHRKVIKTRVGLLQAVIDQERLSSAKPATPVLERRIAPNVRATVIRRPEPDTASSRPRTSIDGLGLHLCKGNSFRQAIFPRGGTARNTWSSAFVPLPYDIRRGLPQRGFRRAPGTRYRVIALALIAHALLLFLSSWPIRCSLELWVAWNHTGTAPYGEATW